MEKITNDLLGYLDEFDYLKIPNKTESEIRVVIAMTVGMATINTEVGIKEAIDIAFNCNYQLPCIHGKIEELQFSRNSAKLSQNNSQKLKL